MRTNVPEYALLGRVLGVAGDRQRGTAEHPQGPESNWRSPHRENPFLGSASWCGTKAARTANARSGFTPAMHLKFLENVVDVVLDRRDLDAEVTGDLLVGESLIHEAQGLELPLGQQRSGSRSGGRRCHFGDAPEEGRGHAGRADRFSLRDA